MLKQNITILLFLLFFLEGVTQVSDSLYSALPDSLRPANKNALTPFERQRLLQRAGYDLPRKYYNEVNQLAEKVASETSASADTAVVINNYFSLASYYYCVPRDNNAFYYYRRMIDIIGNNKAYNNFLITGYKDIGSIYGYGNKKDSAVWYVHKALDIAKEQNDSVAIYSCYEVYSGIYYDMQLFDKAIYYNNLFLLSLRKQDYWGTSYTANVLFNVSSYERLFEKTRQKEYADSVLEIIRRVLLQKRSSSEKWMGACYFFKGRLLYSQAQYTLAENFFDSSLLYKYRENDMYFRSSQPKYFFKALCFIRTGNYAAGKNIIDSLRLTDFSDLKLLNEALYEYAESKGDWKAAFQYHQEYIRYSDSMNVIGLNGFVFDAEQKYSVVEKQAAIARLENEGLLKEKETSRLITVSVFGFLVLLIIIVVLYGLYRRSQLKRVGERQQLTSDLYKMEADMNDERAVHQLVQQALIRDERKRISENIHDEIMSGMAALRYRVAYNKGKIAEEKSKGILAGIEEDVLALYLQAKDFVININKNTPPATGNYNVLGLLKNLSERFNDKSALLITYDCDEENIRQYFTDTIHYQIYLVIKEVIANIIKHANANKVGIRIFFKERYCHFSISDNGRGFDKEKVKSGLGLKSISDRLKVIKGIVEITSAESGTILQGSFPVPDSSQN